jgi:hypothetical protein
MSYVKVENGIIVKYPYTEYDLIKDYPNISYPARIGYGFFADAGAWPVQRTQKPEIDYTKNLNEGDPEQIGNGLWQQVWVVSDASTEEIEQRLAAKWDAVRSRRDKELAASDWTQLPDVALTAEKVSEWSAYRQALRDVTDQPDPFQAVFPAKPE